MKENQDSLNNIIKFFDDVTALVDEIVDIHFPSSLAETYIDPLTDLFETETKVFIIIEIPGVTKENLHIAIGPTMVLVQGIKPPSEQMRIGASFYNLEIAYGIFKKRIYLPSRIKINSSLVSLKNGILTMEFNKDKKAVKMIKIE